MMSIAPMCYETQFLGFTPQTCILRLYISFQDYIFDMLLLVETVILKKLANFPDCGISRFEIRDSTEKYLSFMNECFNHLFQKMEHCLLKLVFKIPRNILLSEDKVHAEYPYSKEKFDDLQSATKTLQEQYKSETFATRSLLAELEEQRIVQSELEEILTLLDRLDKSRRERGNIDLESFAFMVQASKKLEGNVKEMDTKHKKLKLDLSCNTPVRLRPRRSKKEKIKFW